MKTLQPGDIETLRFIANTYGPLIQAAASAYTHRPEVIAGIMMKETRGGKSKLLSDPDGLPDGNPADDTGDHGHGRGLMQIDDRAYPEFCSSEDWKDPEKNIRKGAWALMKKRRSVSALGLRYSILVPDLERASIAAYNCGQGNVMKALRDGLPLDTYTAHGDYSEWVLGYAAAYAALSSAGGPVRDDHS